MGYANSIIFKINCMMSKIRRMKGPSRLNTGCNMQRKHYYVLSHLKDTETSDTGTWRSLPTIIQQINNSQDLNSDWLTPEKTPRAILSLCQ